MSEELRYEEDYEPRQVAAARRVIVDVMQVFASFADCLVLVGGWVPDLLIADAAEPHMRKHRCGFGARCREAE